MKCMQCGMENTNDSVYCVGCGAKLTQSNQSNTQQYAISGAPSIVCELNLAQRAAKLLMVLMTVFQGILILPLFWWLPMTITYCNGVNHGRRVGSAMIAWTILLGNPYAGILMCMGDRQNSK
ncbi:MAG: hypothetical protein E7357_01400 [Clostridiales bacterium]|nr:hypothetical protein [Clostridiales bacterium]